jgi:ribosomal protein L12E/L44/L45/RPP1/RPP2
MDSNSTQLAKIDTVDAIVDAILVDTDTTIPALIAALNDLSSADVNAACDTAISDAALATAAGLATVDSNVDDILTDTSSTIPALITALNDISVSDILTTAMTESYAAAGSAPTLAQALFLIQQLLADHVASGTTLTVRRLNGTTTAATFTFNDADNPSGITRST